MKIATAICIAVLAAAVSAGAQQSTDAPAAAPESLTGVQLKGRAPVNPETLQVQLPRAQETTLENGMQLALLEDRKTPTFAVQLLVRGGGLSDPPDKRGLAMVTAALLREGTSARSSRQIAEQLATLGSSLGAGSSPSSGETYVSVSGLREHLDGTLALAADVVRNPSFPPSEVDKFKTRFLAQLQHQRSLPSFIAREQFMRTIYGEHPGSYIVPPEPVLEALAPADLAQYHRAHFNPANIVLLAYGDLSLADLRASAERAFGDWRGGAPIVAATPPTTPPAKSRVLVVDRPGSVQTSLWVGGLGIERKSEDYFAVLLMNHILGGGPASRLFMNLREDKGYTYGVSSSFTGSTFPGVMVASTDVRTDVTEQAMQELWKELSRIGSEPVTEQELVNAKRALIGRFALSLDSPQSLLANLATQKIYDLPPDYWDTYPQRVEAITAADVQRVAAKYYDPRKMQIVAVGDHASVRDALSRYGAVERIAPGE